MISQHLRAWHFKAMILTSLLVYHSGAWAQYPLKANAVEDERRAESVAAPLVLSDEGKTCLHFLKKQGSLVGKRIILSTTAVVVVFGGVITGMVFAPFFVGSGTRVLVITGETYRSYAAARFFYRKLGQTLEAAYRYLRLMPTSPATWDKAKHRLLGFREDKLVKRYPNSKKSLDEQASMLVSGNESGFFCPATVFSRRWHRLPADIGKFYNESGRTVPTDAICDFLEEDGQTQDSIRSFRQALELRRSSTGKVLATP